MGGGGVKRTPPHCQKGTVRGERCVTSLIDKTSSGVLLRFTDTDNCLEAWHRLCDKYSSCRGGLAHLWAAWPMCFLMGHLGEDDEVFCGEVHVVGEVISAGPPILVSIVVLVISF